VSDCFLALGKHLAQLLAVTENFCDFFYRVLEPSLLQKNNEKIKPE
jgi:hypothetical protein